jgi:hypothetical protein
VFVRKMETSVYFFGNELVCKEVYGQEYGQVQSKEYNLFLWKRACL